MEKYSKLCYFFALLASMLLLLSANCADLLGVTHNRPESRLSISNNSCTGVLYEHTTSRTCTVDIALSSLPSTRIPVEFESNNDLVRSTNRLIFNSANWSEPQTARFTLASDGDATGIESAEVVLNARSRGFLSSPVEVARFTHQQSYCGDIAEVDIDGTENSAFLGGTGTEESPYIVPVQAACNDLSFTYNPNFESTEGIYFQFTADGSTYNIDFIMTEALDPAEGEIILRILNGEPPNLVAEVAAPTVRAGSPFSMADKFVSLRGEGAVTLTESKRFHIDDSMENNSTMWISRKTIRLQREDPEAPPDLRSPIYEGVSVSGINVDPSAIREIVINYNEAIMPGTGSINLIAGGMGGTSTPFAIDNSEQVTVEGQSITLRLQNAMVMLALGTTYTIELPVGVVTDTSGNPNAQISGTTITFSTRSTAPEPDMDPPMFTRLDTSGAAGTMVNPSTNRIVIRFNENIQYISGAMGNIELIADGGATVAYPVGSTQVAIENDTITLTGVMLAPSTTYTITIPANIVEDISEAGNNNGEITGNTITFTTIAGGGGPPPTPVMGMLDISRNTCMGATLYEPAMGTTSTCEIDIALTADPTANVTVSLASDFAQVTAAGDLTFTSTNWDTAQTATINIARTGTADNAGNTATTVNLSASSAAYLAADMSLGSFTYQEAYCDDLSASAPTITTGTTNAFFIGTGTGTDTAPYRVPVQNGCDNLTFVYDPDSYDNGGDLTFQFTVATGMYRVSFVMSEIIEAAESPITLHVDNPDSLTQTVSLDMGMMRASFMGIGVGTAVNVGDAVPWVLPTTPPGMNEALLMGITETTNFRIEHGGALTSQKTIRIRTP